MTPQPKHMGTTIVFGASGFVGANFCANYASNTLSPPRDVVDLTNYNKTLAYLQDHEPDVVVNLAALVGGINFNKNNQADMAHYNLLMGINVIRACHEARINKPIYLGTVCSYPHTPPTIPFIEEDLWAGRPESTNEPYGVAKKTIGLMLQIYYQQYGMKSAYLIPTNMYGPSDNFNPTSSHVIPGIITQIKTAQINKDRSIILWGDGTPSREFLHVDDCCRAIELAIDKIDEPIPINIGTGIETPIK